MMIRVVALILTFVLAIPQTVAADEQVVNVVNNILDKRVSLDVQDADLAGVIKALAESFDLNIVAGKSVTGTVTLSLKNVRLQDVLDLMLESTGYFYRVKDNIILILAPEDELTTEIIKLKYAKPSEILKSLEALKSDQGSIQAIDEENRLVIKETPLPLNEILKEVEKLDKIPEQILIEARMIEVEDTDLSAFGFTWNNTFSLMGLIPEDKAPLGSRGYIQPGFSVSGTTVSPSSTTTTASTDSADFRFALPETSTDLTGGQFAYGFTIQRAQATNIIDALVRQNKAHLLASPSIATMSGQEAKIIIGEKFPFRENTLTAVGTTETTKFIDIGTALRVTPTVVGDDEILLKIHPEVSSLNQSLDAGPRIDTREATTTVIVKNGQSVVIGGLIRHDKTVIRQKVPILGDLPLFGLAFRNKSTDFVTKELAVFITPHLMRPMKPGEEVQAGDPLSPVLFYNRGVRLLDEEGIESLGKTEPQRFSEAISNFESIIRNYPEADVAAAALYQLGKLHAEKLHKYELAVQAWEQLQKDYPDSPYLTKKVLRSLNKVRQKAERQKSKRTG